eukprot:TRINITY_DN7860_c0_g1_i2.p1 TRINITY_DN7860_c0_g1~~TRINITY_DN7860_c0_g1_i2.p1  ORF type:complete len:428 (-),score=71.09 TRINITY_DN7860_c0_g1_i2:26-1309(-)
MSDTDPSIEAKPPLQFTVVASDTMARAGLLTLPHVENALTPMFMPVGTQGTVKGITCDQLREIGFHVILGNTYHLGMRPGPELLEEMGGLHKFMDWDRGILTDSGGFQMVSLLQLAEITEEGVRFQSPHDGTSMLLTPERSIELQNSIGADIIMALDDVVSSTTTGPRVEEATHRTLRWLDRCFAAHKRPHDQILFPIIQGGLDPRLREICLDGIVARKPLGLAIGGLSGGEAKDQFWRTVHLCTQRLPPHLPRYLMGVGYAVDLVVCVALGVDMFDCVYPCRTARFGTALVSGGLLSLSRSEYRADMRPLDPECECNVCRTHTRMAIHAMLATGPDAHHKGATATRLLTYHNLAHHLRLMRRIRAAIVAGTFSECVRSILAAHYPDHNYPAWVRDALSAVQISLPSPQHQTPTPTTAEATEAQQAP